MKKKKVRSNTGEMFDMEVAVKAEHGHLSEALVHHCPRGPAYHSRAGETSRQFLEVHTCSSR